MGDEEFMIHEIDQADKFGTWDDPISQFLYHDSIKNILAGINISDQDRVADYGGANGLLKEFIPQAISIDNDPSKSPDIVDDILTHIGEYDWIIIRFVLHYLNDYQVIDLFDHLKMIHSPKPILLIQFCNKDLLSKYRNSRNELKYFRTQEQLEALIPDAMNIYRKSYEVTPEFYLHRLQIDNTIPHIESLYAYLIR